MNNYPHHNRAMALSPWYWRLLSAIFMVFVVVVFIALLREDARFRVFIRGGLDHQAELIDALKAGREHGDLRDAIRREDRVWRETYFTHLRFQRTGWILLAMGWAGLWFGLRRSLKADEVCPPDVDRLPSPTPELFFRHLHRQRWIILAVILLVSLNAWRHVVRYRNAQQRPATFVSPPSQALTEKKVAMTWPAFRGRQGDGVASYGGLPVHWNGTAGAGVLWKQNLDRPGNSSPIILGNQVILTGADRDQVSVYSFDLHTGKSLWIYRRPSALVGKESSIMQETGYAAPTPAGNGKFIWALFADGTLVALDMEGKERWMKVLGVPENIYGHASSPVTDGKNVYLQFDQGNPEDKRSQLMAFDGASGRTLWAVTRELGSSWATPVIIAPVNEAPFIVTCATPSIMAYALNDGRFLWKADCLGGEVAPSPVYADPYVIAANLGASLSAVRVGGTGDVTSTHRAWSADEDLPDICSPLVYSNKVYTLTTAGVLTCRALTDGKKLWSKDLGMTCQASPAAGQGRLYIQAEQGTTFIVQPGTNYQEIARNELGEGGANASPAFAENALILRTKDHVWCLSGDAVK